MAKGERCCLAAVVLCELARVLRGAYGLEKSAVVAVLEQMLSTVGFEIEEKDVVRRALEDYRDVRRDFAGLARSARSKRERVLDEKHRVGYARKPVLRTEFGVREPEHTWPRP